MGKNVKPNDTKSRWQSSGLSLTLIPILASTFVDPILPAQPPETPE